MEEVQSLLQASIVALSFKNLALMFVGIVLGVIIGVLPGLGGANGVAILLPLTFSMSPTSAIIMLSCIYWGALFWGGRCGGGDPPGPVQHTRRALVGGDDLRRLSDGAEGQGRRGAYRRIYLL